MSHPRRPKRRHPVSLPRMTRREQAECLGWEIIAAAVWVVAAILAVGAFP